MSDKYTQREVTRGDWKTNATRADCVRDNVGVRLPLACFYNGGVTVARRGMWIEVGPTYRGREFLGRVLGRVRCEGRVYVEVIAALGIRCTPCVRWVEAAHITGCLRVPPAAALAFLCGEWRDMPRVVARATDGIPDEAARVARDAAIESDMRKRDRREARQRARP